MDKIKLQIDMANLMIYLAETKAISGYLKKFTMIMMKILKKLNFIFV